MSLMIYSVGPGDAVFTTPFTFIATAEVVSLLGATPAFVDIDPETFNIDPMRLEQAIKTFGKGKSQDHPLPAGYKKIKPKDIILVDLFGQCADYDAINTLARDHGLFDLENSCQSFGAVFRGKNACSLADVAATSFFPVKPLGCYSDGGMVFIDDDELVRKLISIRVQGSGANKYDNIRLGINGRLDTLQAAINLAKFAIFPEEVEFRKAVAGRYNDLLAKSGIVKCPYVAAGALNVWSQYSLLGMQRDKIPSALKATGIPTAIYYPIPLHLQGHTATPIMPKALSLFANALPQVSSACHAPLSPA